ncbi:hypothetical protein C8J57DRAFT_1259118 [Mycena rebaudengoi]|nr:hypothetical protein C8J57DRAFT_1259118 [Mycena rebaudengoi]
MFFKTLILFSLIAAALALSIGPTPVCLPQNICSAHCVEYCIGRRVRLRAVNRTRPADASTSLSPRLIALASPAALVFSPVRFPVRPFQPNFIAGFFDAAGYISKDADTVVVLLHGGAYNFWDPGISGNVDFNDRTSSSILDLKDLNALFGPKEILKPDHTQCTAGSGVNDLPWSASCH